MVASGRLEGRRQDRRAGRQGDQQIQGRQALRAGHRGRRFSFGLNDEKVAAEAALDGLYVIRTSVAEADMTRRAAVRNYKPLADVERPSARLKTSTLRCARSATASKTA